LTLQLEVYSTRIDRKMLFKLVLIQAAVVFEQ
ncbi:MAG: hypothetical protein ACJAXU_002221, partial [Paracoccaceae bacterium]